MKKDKEERNSQRAMAVLKRLMDMGYSENDIYEMIYQYQTFADSDNIPNFDNMRKRVEQTNTCQRKMMLDKLSKNNEESKSKSR